MMEHSSSRSRSSNSAGSRAGSKATDRGPAPGGSSLSATSERPSQRGERESSKHAPMSAASSAKGSQPAASSSGSLSFEQTALAWTDIEPGKAAASEERVNSIAEGMRRMFPTAQPDTPDNQAEMSKSAVSRSPAGCGEEFIVSPSPLAIALASRKGSYSGPADTPLKEGASSKKSSGAPQRLVAPAGDSRRARSVHEASSLRRPTGADHPSMTTQNERQEPPNASSQKRPLLLDAPLASITPAPTTSLEWPSLQSDARPRLKSGLSERHFAPPSASWHRIAASSSAERPAAQQGPPQLPSAARDFASGEQGRPGPVHAVVAVPPILAEWVTSQDAAEVLAKILGVARARLRGVEQSAVRFEAEEEEALQEAQGLLQSHLNHKAGVEEKRRVKRELELIEQEFRDGLRCEFQVPLQALPHLIGADGSNLAQVQAECGVERVLVDSDESTVRIVGRSREAVAAARSRLEYDAWSLPLARDLWQSTGDRIEALLEHVRTKNKLAEAEVQEDEQGLWVSLVGRKVVLAEAARVVEGQLQLLEMMQVEAAEVADVSEEQVKRVSRTWGVQPRPGPPAGGPPLPAPPARLQAHAARAPPTAPSRGPRVAAQVSPREWEDIEPPRMGPDQNHATGWGAQTGSPGQVPGGGAAHPNQLGRLQPQVGPGAPSNGFLNGEAGVVPTGWGQAAPDGPPTTRQFTGPARGQGSLPSVSKPVREPNGPTQVAGGSGGWGEVPAFQHDVQGGTETRIVTRRPLSATPNRLAASVLANVVSSRQKEGAQTSRGRGGMGASPEKSIRADRSYPEGEMKGRPMQTVTAESTEQGRAPNGQASRPQEYWGSSLGMQGEEPPGATGWGDTPGVNRGGLQDEHGRGQVGGSGFWTLGSPPGATLSPSPLNQEPLKSTWDAAWPNSAVTGRTNWGQQRPEGQPVPEARGSAQRSVPPGRVTPAPLPEPAASSEHVSSGWRGQPRSAASGSLSSSQQGPSAGRGEPSTATSGPLPRRRVEVINANAVPPPDVSTLLRTPSTKAGVRPALAAPFPTPAAAEPLSSSSAAARPPSEQPLAAPPAKAPARKPEDAIVLVTASEGSGSGRVPPLSRHLIGRPSTASSLARSQPQAPKASPAASLEQEAPRNPAQDGRSASLPEASSASRGSVSGRTGRGALTRVVSSLSSTGSTSNSKLVHRGRGEGAGRENGPGQGAPLGAFHGDTQEGASKEEAQRPERTQGEAYLPQGGQEQEFEQPAFVGRDEEAHDPVAESGHTGAQREAEGGGVSVTSVRGSDVERLGPAEVAEARDAALDGPGRGEEAERTEAATVRGQDGEEGAVAGGSGSDAVQTVEQGVDLVSEPAAPHGAPGPAAGLGPKAGNESKGPNEAREGVNGWSASGQSRARKWASETSEEEQRAEEGRAAQQGATHEEGPTGNGHGDCAQEEAALANQQGVVAGGPSGWAEAEDTEAEAEAKPSGWGTANHVNGALEEEGDHVFAQRTGWDARPGSGMRPWSDEAAPPVRRGKGAGSGSWVSDDSGSVRSVGIDVGRWAEEAAISTLSEHEALLQDSPHGFKGATDSGSRRGGSTGSSRTGSSEGRRGPVYRMKMQKFQLAAIKANQVGGGAPTGWEAVPEEGAPPAEGTEGLPGTEPGLSLRAAGPPAAVHPEPQDVREWVRPKLRPDRAGPLLDTPGPNRRPAVPPARRTEPQRQERPPAPARPLPADVRSEPDAGFPADEAVPATGWGSAEPAGAAGPQEALAEGGADEARDGWGERPPERAGASTAGARQGERRGGRQEERTRPAEVYDTANEEAARETQVALEVEEHGAPTGWGGDVAGAPGVQSEAMAHPEEERGAPEDPVLAEYAEMSEERDYGAATADEAQPTGWAEEREAERGGPYEESWDEEDDASVSGAGSSPRGGLRQAPARIGVQDVRLVEGTLPATALKRSTVTPTLLPGTQTGGGRAQEAAGRMEVGVQDARLLPVERTERLERLEKWERRKKGKPGGKKERDERRRRARGSKTPQGASPGGETGERGVLPRPPRQTPGASGDRTPSPSEVPLSGWSAGGGSPVTPASILQVGEQPSPRGRSSRVRKERGPRGTKEQAQPANEGRTGRKSAEASGRERGSKRADASWALDTGAGILGKGGPVAPSGTSEKWPGESIGKQASSRRRSAGNGRATRLDAGRDASQDSSRPHREDGTSPRPEAGSVASAAAVARKESDGVGSAGDADRQSSGSAGQHGGVGQSAKRAFRPSGVWSVRNRRETTTSSA